MKQAYFRRRILFLLAALLAAITALAPAAAQAPPPAPAEAAQPAKLALPPDVSDSVTRLTTAIETAEKTIQHLAELEEELGGLRVDVETILADSTQTAETLRPELAAVRSQIEKLAPPPGKDGPAEAPALAAERARLTALAAGLDGAIKSTELTWVRARQLIEKITILRHSLFTKNLMERRPSPLLPELWRDLVNKSPAVGHRISYLAEDWLHWANIKRQQVGTLLAAVLILFVALKYAIARPTNRRRVRSEPPLPTFFERARSVAWVAPLRALPAIAAATLLYGGLDTLDLLFPPWAATAAAILGIVLIVLAFVAAAATYRAARDGKAGRAVGMALAVLDWPIDAALRKAPRLAEMRERLARREAIARYVAEGRRPTRFTGSPSEGESIERIRRYVGTTS